MKTFKRILSIIMVAAVIATLCVAGTLSTGASGTGIGLAEWCMNAYYSDWSYVWGGSSPGAVDCSGLIWSYCGGNRTSMLSDAQANGRDWGYVSSGIPNIHGLGLSRPGHVGVYVGNGMEVDARGSGYGVCYQAVGGWNNWDCWFKLTAVSYPVTGWEKFNGDYYYYENGEYLTDTSRTIDGVTYYFASSGVSSQTPADTSAKADTTSSSSSSSSSDTSADSGVLKKGSNGSLVEKLQARLQELGYYNGAIDGDFGEVTEEAFKQFQKTAGLYVDGIAGSDVDYLYADDAPSYAAEAEEAVQTEEKEDLASTGASPEDTDTDDAPAEEAAEAAMSYGIGDYSDDILLIQNKLIELNYLTGEADGSFGTMTEEAVKSFQTANGLEATGIVEQTTYDKLFSDTAVAAEKKAEEPEQTDEAKADEDAAAVAKTAAAAQKTAAAPNTEVEVKTAALSSKSVAAVTDSPLFKRGANATNFEFILWLGIMIVVMLITFAIVYAVEKKKQKAAYRGRRFQ